MPEYRYRAYISYSHADQKWAAWLQRALESYRVPARLAVRADGSPLPRRISPVFRDREDLATAHNLSDSLVEALRASEALIIVCSPAAASSTWVNEEVRQFQALGRAARVLCMIVDGDPGAPVGQGGCFPPALFDGVQDSEAEPLAADAREFADGKKLAKLKLVAGLLGVRLDELQRRDLRRKRRWQAAGAVAVTAALTLAVLAVTARVAERQERVRAEQMATFIVDLGEDLQAELDLESLARISGRAMQYLQNLDPGKLSLETSVRVGLALRQVGLVNLQQGKFPEALEALEQSRSLFRELTEQHSGRQDVLFELGQAEFYVGENHRQEGAIDLAWGPWQNYYDISRLLYDSDPADPRWLLELSYATGNLLLLRIESAQVMDQQLLEDVEESVRLAKRAHDAQPESSEALANYSNAVAWAADAQYLACNLVVAGQYREITLEQAENASANDPSNNVLQRYKAYGHSGLAMILRDQGNLAEAERHRLAAIEILSGLWAKDRSNKLLAIDVAANKLLLATLMAETGRLETAAALLREAEPELQPTEPLDQVPDAQLEAYSNLLLDNVELSVRKDDIEGARKALTRMLELADLRRQKGLLAKVHEGRLAHARYLWWQWFGEDPAARYPVLEFDPQEADGHHQSCINAEIVAKLAILNGNQELARKQADYLAKKGYWHPRYLLFCQRHGLCAR